MAAKHWYVCLSLLTIAPVSVSNTPDPRQRPCSREFSRGLLAIREAESTAEPHLDGRIGRESILEVERTCYQDAERECAKRNYPKATLAFLDLLERFPNGRFRNRAFQWVPAIADCWLEETHAELERHRGGNRTDHWSTWSAFVSFDEKMPLLFRERCAVAALEKLASLNSSDDLIERALYTAGSVHFFRERYEYAQQDFGRLIELRRKGPLTESAVVLIVACKTLPLGENGKPTRKELGDIWEFIQKCRRDYPNVAAKRDHFFILQMARVRMLLSEHDFEIGEAFAQAGRPVLAGLVFGFVNWEYAGTPYAIKAQNRLRELFPRLAGFLP